MKYFIISLLLIGLLYINSNADYAKCFDNSDEIRLNLPLNGLWCIDNCEIWNPTATIHLSGYWVDQPPNLMDLEYMLIGLDLEGISPAGKYKTKVLYRGRNLERYNK